MPPIKPTPLPTLLLTTHHVPAHPTLSIPNTSLAPHPLYHYHTAFPPTTSPSHLESHLRRNLLSPQWRYTMYPTTHYHSTTHEILVPYSGSARLLFGGEGNPGAVEVRARAGDCLVVPAGVGHRLLSDEGDGDGDGGGFMMVGAYPMGCAWDMCYGKDGEEGKSEAVRKVAWLAKDPVYGDDGPVLWSAERLAKHQKDVEAAEGDKKGEP